MFSKDLSLSILQLCSSRNLSYEKAAELCDLSPRCFGSIARGQTNVSIITFEKLCTGFELTPNELLRIQPLIKFEMPKAAGEKCFICGLDCYPVCPCRKPDLDRSGRELNWKDYCSTIITLDG